MIYYIIGIRRSGLHAIANWLFPMMGEYIYLNNYELGKLTDIEMVVNGKFNVLIGIESKPVGEILKYCDKGKRIWVRRRFVDVERSQREWYKDKYDGFDVENKLAKSRSLDRDYSEALENLDDQIILYENWNTDLSYRQRVSGYLGLQFDDANKEKIFGYGVSSYNT